MRNSIFLTIPAAMLIACGAPGETTSGTGGDGASTASSSGTGGSGATSSTSSSSSSSGEMCNPTPENDQCMGKASCDCPVGVTTEQAWCDTWPGICPQGPGLDECEPGQNRCGYDLAMGENFNPPVCKDHVNGDTWQDSSGQFTSQFGNSSGYTNIGQFSFALGNLWGPNAGYYDGLILSENRVSWNLRLRNEFKFAQGEFAADCKTLTVRLYEPGAADGDPYSKATFTWMHSN